MKRVVALFVIGCMLTGLTACNESNQNSKVNQVLESQISMATDSFPDPTLSSDIILQSQPQPTQPSEIPEDIILSNTEGIDIDLTMLNSTMVYAEVYDMMYNPETYYGKVVRMQGTCATYTDPETGFVYYACLIKDATACCSQGVEFTLISGENYPEEGSDITVTGTFGSYEEDGYLYVRLENSVMTF